MTRDEFCSAVIEGKLLADASDGTDAILVRRAREAVRVGLELEPRIHEMQRRLALAKQTAAMTLDVLYEAHGRTEPALSLVDDEKTPAEIPSRKREQNERVP